MNNFLQVSTNIPFCNCLDKFVEQTSSLTPLLEINIHTICFLAYKYNNNNNFKKTNDLVMYFFKSITMECSNGINDKEWKIASL